MFRRDRYAFEPQFAAAEPLAFIAPLLSTNDLPTATLAAQLWASWLGDYTFIFDQNANAWIKTVAPGTTIPGAVVAQPALFVNTQPPGNQPLDPNTGALR